MAFGDKMDANIEALREEWRQAVDGMDSAARKWEAENRDPRPHEMHEFNRFKRKAEEKREQYELAQTDEGGAGSASKSPGC
jgi:hypothetical protein